MDFIEMILFSNKKIYTYVKQANMKTKVSPYIFT